MAATGATSKPILNAKGEALEQSRTDAGVLLWFATREGKKVAERVLSNIVNAQSQLNSPQRTALVEARFWTAYRDLAAAVKPASVESILSTCSSHPFRDYGGKWTLWNRNKLGNARKTKRWYAIAAVLVLIFLLVIQTYWFVMTTFSASLETNRNELDSIAGALRVMDVLEGHDTLHLPKDAAIQDLLRNDREGLLTNQPTLAAIIAEQQPSLQVISILNLDLKNKSYRIQRLSSRVHNELKVLQEPWKVLWYLFVRPPADAPSAGDDTRPDGNGIPSDDGEIAETSSPVPVSMVEQEQLVEEADEVIAANLAFGGFQRTKQEFQDFLRREQDRLNNVFTLESLEHVLSQSKSMPAILSQYFLPMLYGLLGSLTWILRALSKEIQDVTFTRGSATRYSLRWPLGMLAGVTVGLFFDPAHFAGLAALTPLGVAFLAGYGVELFFTGVDGLVRAFTGEGPERRKAEAA